MSMVRFIFTSHSAKQHLKITLSCVCLSICLVLLVSLTGSCTLVSVGNVCVHSSQKRSICVSLYCPPSVWIQLTAELLNTMYCGRVEALYPLLSSICASYHKCQCNHSNFKILLSTCISLHREICPLFNHVKYYRMSEIVLTKMT